VHRFAERTDPATGERYVDVFERGTALKDDPLLNKGTAFSEDERRALGLLGLLPPAVHTMAEQARRAYENYLEARDDVGRYVFLAALQDRNETLFSRLVADHLEEMVPIIYTPTVGKACERYSHIYRRARGLYITPSDRGRIVELLRNAPVSDPRVIVLTDNEAILGIGDQGVGGMPIAIGKLALYTAGAGIHPSACLPIDLDVGTDNAALLSDPLYLGVRQPRLRGAPYLALLDELVDGIARVFPGVLLQWEDFASGNAFAVLERYRHQVLSFNDDIQGTGAVVVAGVCGAARQAGRPFADERVVFFGAGASGAGSALAVRAALRESGVSESELPRRVLCLDSKGLILADRPGLDDVKRQIAVPRDVVAGWATAQREVFRLGDVVRAFGPTALVGASGQAGAFTESIVRDLAAGCPRPTVLALSNPTSKVEATPDDVLRWTNGAAIVGTGSPFEPVTVGGRRFTIGQGNNVLVFPGVGLGATAIHARWLPDSAFSAAARALAELTAASTSPGDPLFPPLRRLREVARSVALAVARELVRTGAAPSISDAEIERRVTAVIWTPAYLRYRAGRPPSQAIERELPEPVEPRQTPGESARDFGRPCRC
jgi:malate dehydrogenase (oxaloacetate-decarboxylating)